MCIITAIIFSYALVTVDASLYDFTKVGECILGYNPWFDLLRHGCYCGFGNHGDAAPEDGYDECCKEHDYCYGNLTDVSPIQCPSLLAEYLLPYWFVCKPFTNVFCYVDPPFSWFPWWKSCGEGLCHCDRDMMLCWKSKRKNASDTRERPDKRYCNRTKNNLPPPPDPSWFDYFENVVTFYRDVNRHHYENAEEVKRQMKLDKERLNAINDWAQGRTRHPIRMREPDDNHLPQSNSWPVPHPNQVPQAPALRLPWKRERSRHPDWSPPNTVDYENFAR